MSALSFAYTAEHKYVEQVFNKYVFQMLKDTTFFFFMNAVSERRPGYFALFSCWRRSSSAICMYAFLRVHEVYMQLHRSCMIHLWEAAYEETAFGIKLLV